jgi:hypothetical protein
MDITLAANRGGIAKKLCHCANGGFDIGLSLLFGLEFSLDTKSQR